MKTALILLSALTSGILSRGLEDKNLEVSFGQARTGVRKASTRFFWCQIYQGNCVSGCSVNPCDAICTVSSWLATCEYQCGDVTDQCTQTGGDGGAPTPCGAVGDGCTANTDCCSGNCDAGNTGGFRKKRQVVVTTTTTTTPASPTTTTTPASPTTTTTPASPTTTAGNTGLCVA